MWKQKLTKTGFGVKETAFGRWKGKADVVNLTDGMGGAVITW